MTFKVEILKISKNTSEHIDLMDLVNHNEDPLLKQLGSPFTDFMWRMIGDAEITVMLSKCTDITDKVVYALGMTLNGVDYMLSTHQGKELAPSPFIQHKARMYDTLKGLMVKDCVSVFRPNDVSLAEPDALEAYLVHLTQPTRDK